MKRDLLSVQYFYSGCFTACFNRDLFINGIFLRLLIGRAAFGNTLQRPLSSLCCVPTTRRSHVCSRRVLGDRAVRWSWVRVRDLTRGLSTRSVYQTALSRFNKRRQGVRASICSTSDARFQLLVWQNFQGCRRYRFCWADKRGTVLRYGGTFSAVSGFSLFSGTTFGGPG